MAVLTDEERREIWVDFQRLASAARESLPLTKAELRAAVNALDDYFNSNTAALNTAIPQPARGALTTRQKLFLGVYVLTQRARKA